MMDKAFGMWIAIVLIIGIAVASFTFSKCGPKAFLFGDAGFFVAASGMCDKE